MEQRQFAMVLTLVVLVILIGFSISMIMEYRKYVKSATNLKFPPWPSKCPDYWTSKGDNVCENKHGLGICKAAKNNNIMDFNEEGIFKGQKGMYYKCAWAKKCETPWEGIDSLC